MPIKPVIADEKANMQLASANYVDLVKGDAAVDNTPELVKQKRSVPLAKEEVTVETPTTKDSTTPKKDL